MNRQTYPSLVLYSKIELVHTGLIFCDFFSAQGCFIFYFMYIPPSPLILLVLLFKIAYVKEIGWSLLCGMCVCIRWGWGIETGWGLEFPGCVEDVVWVMDVTSLPFLRRLASSRLALVDDSQPETKMQASQYTLPCAETRFFLKNENHEFCCSTPNKILYVRPFYSIKCSMVCTASGRLLGL